MVNRIVVSRADGRGGLRIPVQHSKDFAGKRFSIAGKALTITTDGRVNIPKSVMEKYGSRMPDGRYALAVDVGYRHDDGRLKVGGYINELGKVETNYKTGDTISYSDVIDNEVINPTTDDTEYYTVGD